jgi:hypothetical protein
MQHSKKWRVTHLLLVFMFCKVLRLSGLFCRIYTSHKYWIIFPVDIIRLGCWHIDSIDIFYNWTSMNHFWM